MPCKSGKVKLLKNPRPLAWQHRDTEALTGEVLLRVDVREESIIDDACTVAVTTAAGERLTIREDGNGVHLIRNGAATTLTSAPINLPEFPGHPHQRLLKISTTRS